MRTTVVGVIVSSCIVVCIACGGSGGGAPGGNQDGGPGNGSTTGSVTGSCPALGSTYAFHWTYVSGGTLCEQNVPADSMPDIDAGLAMASVGVDAGGCPATISGCNYSQTCPLPLGDAATGQSTENITVAADGSISGTLSVSESTSIAGTTIMVSCEYSLVGTKE